MPLFFIIIVSCTYAVSKETIKEASDVPFRTVRENIEDYVGKQFVWGGFIARNRLTDEGTYLEVVQNPTNRYGRVVDTDMSEGRFLVFSKREMDPLIYEKGRVVTVAGTLKEAKTVTINGREYTYPVLELGEMHLWKGDPMNVPDYYYYGGYPYYWGGGYSPPRSNWPYWYYPPY
jgi:outer membrane lipoprotein